MAIRNHGCKTYIFLMIYFKVELFYICFLVFVFLIYSSGTAKQSVIKLDILSSQETILGHLKMSV